MKKYSLSICALVVAIGFSAFKTFKYATYSFHYIPPNVSELQYENTNNWEARASHPECDSIPNDVCILRIDDSKLSPYSGTDVEKLVQYLTDQNGTDDYFNSTEAVENLTFSKKP